MKRLCVALGKNEHKILSVLKDSDKIYISLDSIKSKTNFTKYYSILSTSLIKLVEKEFIAYNGTMLNLIKFRYERTLEERRDEAYQHEFTITEKGKLLLQLFKSGK